jgi:hypothetical protein
MPMLCRRSSIISASSRGAVRLPWRKDRNKRKFGAWRPPLQIIQQTGFCAQVTNTVAGSLQALLVLFGPIARTRPQTSFARARLLATTPRVLLTGS